jgi:hypothetical protein
MTAGVIRRCDYRIARAVATNSGEQFMSTKDRLLGFPEKSIRFRATFSEFRDEAAAIVSAKVGSVLHEAQSRKTHAARQLSSSQVGAFDGYFKLPHYPRSRSKR